MLPAMQATGLGFIQPLEITLPIDGVDVTIKPLVLGELPTVLAAMVPVFAAIPAMGPGYAARLVAGELREEEVSDLLSAVAVDGHQMIALLALVTRQPVEWLNTLLLDRAVELGMVCYQVNADFFRRAMPAIRAKALQLARPPEQSSVASPAAPTSSTTATPSSS